jgi:hypothetical protein
MRRPICIAALIAVILSLSGFSSYAQPDKALADCKMKALDTVGPKPSQDQPMSTGELSMQGKGREQNPGLAASMVAQRR